MDASAVQATTTNRGSLLGNGVLRMSTSATSDASKLTTVYLPDNLDYNGELQIVAGALAGNKKLTKVGTKLGLGTNDNSRAETNGLIAPKNLTIFGADAFNSAAFETVDLSAMRQSEANGTFGSDVISDPNGNNAGARAFANISTLTSVKLPT